MSIAFTTELICLSIVKKLVSSAFAGVKPQGLSRTRRNSKFIWKAMSQTGNKVVKAIAGFLGILVAGVVGYMYFENINFVDALYMTIITVSTVGYGDMVPVHISGKIFTVFMVLCGVGYVMYMFSKIMETVVEGGLRQSDMCNT